MRDLSRNPRQSPLCCFKQRVGSDRFPGCIFHPEVWRNVAKLSYAFEFGADCAGFLHLLFDLRRDEMSDGIIRQIEERIDHVRIHGQQDDIFLVKHRSVVAVPNVFRDLQCRGVELAWRGLRMVIHPVPDGGIDQTDTCNLVSCPEVVKRFLSLASGIRRGQTKQLKIATLKNKRQRFRPRHLMRKFVQRCDPFRGLRC